MSDQDAKKPLEDENISSSTSLNPSSGTTAATTPDPSQSRRESYDVNAAAGADGMVDAAKVSSNLTSIASSDVDTTAATDGGSVDAAEVSSRLTFLASYDVNAAAGANETVDAAKVSSKLITLAKTAVPFIVPGSDEGHPVEPMLRKFDPTKDSNLTIEELLARPAPPRTPSERLAMAKLQLAASGVVANELTAEEQAALKKANREKKAAFRKADREEHMQRILAMAKDFPKLK